MCAIHSVTGKTAKDGKVVQVPPSHKFVYIYHVMMCYHDLRHSSAG